MALEIKYEDLCKDFRITEDGRLFRLLKGGSWREVIIKNNYVDGYCRVKWRGKMYLSHRLMYCLYHQVDVDTDLSLDHKNGDTLDNSVDNLRLLTDRGNNQNKECHRNGKLVGYRLYKNGKYEAQIRINGKQISLGYYDTEQQAHQAYLTACNMLDKSIDEIKEFFNIRTKNKCSSKYKCVHWHKASKKWVACVTVDGKQKHIGSFDNEEDAHQAILNFNS